MEHPEQKLQSIRNLLKSLKDDLHTTEKQILSLEKTKESLIKNISETEEKIIVLETITDQYDELVKSFEAKKNDLLSKIIL